MNAAPTAAPDSTLATISAVLASAALLALAGGLQGLLVPLAAKALGFTDLIIGLLGAGYYLGFFLGCLFNRFLIETVGHIRAFTIFAASSAALLLLLPILPLEAVWLAVRVPMGLTYAGMFMVLESWLNARSTIGNRGRVLGLYLFLNYLLTVVGHGAIALGDISGFVLFSLGAMLFCLALMPVAGTRATAPAPMVSARLDLIGLTRTSPAAVIGTFASGLTAGGIGALIAVFALATGFSARTAAIMTAGMALAGALSQVPLGALSDRIDRRYVILGCLLVGGLAAALLGTLTIAGIVPLLALVWLYAAAVTPLYGLSIAHANDWAPPERMVETASGLLLVFALGGIAGSTLGGALMSAFEPSALFLLAAGLLAVSALAIGLRLGARARPDPESRTDYTITSPRTTPATLALDPGVDGPGPATVVEDDLTAAAERDQAPR